MFYYLSILFEIHKSYNKINIFLHPMELFAENLQSLECNLSGRIAVGASTDSRIKVYTVEKDSFTLASELEGHNGAVTKALFVGTGEIMVSADFTGLLIIWKQEGLSFERRVEKQLLNGPIYDISVRSLNKGLGNEEFVVECACDGGVLKSLKFTNTMEESVEEQKVHEYGISLVDCNSDYSVTAGLDNRAVFISGKSQLEFFSCEEGITALKITRKNCFDKTFVAVGCETGDFLIFEHKAGNMELLHKVSLKKPIFSLQWSKGGFSVSVCYGETGEIKAYEIDETGKFVEVETV
ncbi:hypothetical protein NUSPORA_02122 [Nucleospora cyclopteri]